MQTSGYKSFGVACIVRVTFQQWKCVVAVAMWHSCVLFPPGCPVRPKHVNYCKQKNLGIAVKHRDSAVFCMWQFLAFYRGYWSIEILYSSEFLFTEFYGR